MIYAKALQHFNHQMLVDLWIRDFGSTLRTLDLTWEFELGNTRLEYDPWRGWWEHGTSAYIVDPQLITAVRPQSGNHNFVVFDRNDKARHGAMAMEREIQVMSPGICFGLELLVISPTLGPLGSPLGSIRAFRGRDWNAWTLKCAKMWCWKHSDLQLPQNRGFVFLMQSFFPWYQIALKTLKKNMIGSIHLFMFRLYGAIYFLVGGIISLTSTEFDIVQVTPDAGRRLLLDYRCQQGLQVANGVWAQTQAMDFRPCNFSGYWGRMRQHIPKGTMSSCHHGFIQKWWLTEAFTSFTRSAEVLPYLVGPGAPAHRLTFRVLNTSYLHLGMIILHHLLTNCLEVKGVLMVHRGTPDNADGKLGYG